MMSVFKINEEWDSDVTYYAPTKLRKAPVMKMKKMPSLKVDTTDPDYYTNYTIMPVSASVVTGVSNVTAAKQVTNVTYINTLGVQSTTPFRGINIVVTHFDDGTRTVTKLVK